MSDDDNERTAALAEDVHASAHELRTDALSLAIGQHGHRGQAHPDDSSRCVPDDHRGKKNVTDNDVCHSDEGQRVATSRSQLLDQVSFRGLPKRELIEVSHS
jgi:hypothetical protein